MLDVLKDEKPIMNWLILLKSILQSFPEDSFTWIASTTCLIKRGESNKKQQIIHFVGGLTNSDVHKKMEQSDLFITTTKYDVLPMSILEAVVHSNIILVSHYHYYEDITSRFKSSLSFKSAEQVLELRNNKTKFKLKQIAVEENQNLRREYSQFISKYENLFDLNVT